MTAADFTNLHCNTNRNRPGANFPPPSSMILPTAGWWITTM